MNFHFYERPYSGKHHKNSWTLTFLKLRTFLDVHEHSWTSINSLFPSIPSLIHTVKEYLWMSQNVYGRPRVFTGRHRMFMDVQQCLWKAKNVSGRPRFYSTDTNGDGGSRKRENPIPHRVRQFLTLIVHRSSSQVDSNIAGTCFFPLLHTDETYLD